eukprot:TRINITY_DN21704_c0_g1_i1.p1 TRINITY_DN21704_c0_g1~~TRINITY_DN21704_c0_g1_i1.p1  ORF type:complete len:115 (+),score=1.64 TRINITY_DN21704_c0_g1_i1:43-345(+)
MEKYPFRRICVITICYRFACFSGTRSVNETPEVLSSLLRDLARVKIKALVAMYTACFGEGTSCVSEETSKIRPYFLSIMSFRNNLSKQTRASVFRFIIFI